MPQILVIMPKVEVKADSSEGEGDQGDKSELGEETLEKDSGSIGLREDILLYDPEVLAAGNNILEEYPALQTSKETENGNNRGVLWRSPQGEQGYGANDEGIG